MGGLTSGSSFTLQKEGVSGGKMDRKKKAMELMGKQSGSGMPSKAPSPMEQGPVLNETGAQPEAGRFMNAIAKRKAMKGMKK